MVTVAAPAVRDVRRDGITAALGCWLLVGLFLDGYMHNTRHGELESFVTPWHAVLYTGYLAAAAWISFPAVRQAGTIQQRLAALPEGYAPGAVGALIFAVGGIADAAWHSSFGIEVGIEALLSPPHLVLLAGAMLIVTTPARSAWRSWERTPTFLDLLPALVSITLATLLVGFFLMYASGLYHVSATASYVASSPGPYQMSSAAEAVARFVTTVIVMVPALLILGRWTPPWGAFTLLFTAYAASMLVLAAFERPHLALAGPVAGVVADLLAARLRPAPGRPGAVRAFATAVPGVLWISHVALLAATGDLGWPFTLWGGVVLLAAATGFALSLLAVAPADSRSHRRPVSPP